MNDSDQLNDRLVNLQNQTDLGTLRQLFLQLLEIKNEERHKQKMDLLDKFSIKLTDEKLDGLSIDLSTVQCPEDEEKLWDELVKNLFLLKIFIRKATCPISQVVDNL